MRGVNVILSYRYHLLQSFTPQHTRPRILSGGQTAYFLILGASLGVLIPTALYRTGSPYNSGLPRPTLSAPRVSTLSAVFVSPILPGLFHPGALLGFSLQSLPFQKSRRASRRPLPSCRYRPASSAVDANLPLIRIRKRSGNPTSGFYSLLESVLPGLEVSQRLGPVLSWASPSSGLFSSSATQLPFRRCSSLVVSSLPPCAKLFTISPARYLRIE